MLAPLGRRPQSPSSLPQRSIPGRYRSSSRLNRIPEPQSMWLPSGDGPASHHSSRRSSGGRTRTTRLRTRSPRNLQLKFQPSVFKAEMFDSRLGRGYGEALMLEQLARAGIGSKYVLKCTGRLGVANIGSLLTSLDSGPDIVIRLTKDFAYADSWLFVVSSELLSDLTSNLANEVNDSRGSYLEHALARRVLRLAGEGAHVRFWASWPRLVGRSGATGQRYDSVRSQLLWPAKSLLYRIKRLESFL